MSYNNIVILYFFSSFLVHFALFLLHFTLFYFIFELNVLNWLICLFFLMNLFLLFVLKLVEKIFWGSHPGINFGAIYYPSLPFTILISNLIFLYIIHYQFVTILKRSFHHWDGFKNTSRKNSKNRICYYWRVWHCWRTVHIIPIIPHHPHHPISLTHTTPIIPTTQYHPISYYLFPFPFPPSSQTLISIGVIAFILLHNFKQEYKVMIKLQILRLL